MHATCERRPIHDIMMHGLHCGRTRSNDSQSASPARENLKLDMLVSGLTAAADDNTPPTIQLPCLAARQRGSAAEISSLSRLQQRLASADSAVCCDVVALQQARDCPLACLSKRGGRLRMLQNHYECPDKDAVFVHGRAV